MFKVGTQIFLILCITISLFADEKPNFTGVWKFNPQKGSLQTPVPSSSIFRINHREPRFWLSRTHVFDGDNETWTINLTTDGKEVIQQEPGMTTHARLYWDKNELVLDSKLILKDKREASNVVRYSLSSDGRVFTAIEKFRGPIVKYDNVWVFEKQ